jgi:hypothetical protein
MFDWNEYFKLAENFSKQAPYPFGSEAYMRTAVSRAYYAAYHKVRKFAEKTDGVLLAEIKNEEISDMRGGNRRRGDHEVMVEFLKKSHASFFNTEGVILDRLRIDRVKCDYYDEVKNINQNAILAIEMARKILIQIP